MCMDQPAVPVKRVWLGIAARLGLRRKTGLRKLRKEVLTCEYHDVHVMWQMLRATDGPVPLAEKEAAAAAAGARKRRNAWRRFIYYCCAF
ncbi:uncharacterized protein [Miscanthus floridulus]|uniref:uncharacterized protein n=1 Tax=Miscanthus floridulus TaxID=154761 RepID=UPI0034597D89